MALRDYLPTRKNRITFLYQIDGLLSKDLNSALKKLIWLGSLAWAIWEVFHFSQNDRHDALKILEKLGPPLGILGVPFIARWFVRDFLLARIPYTGANIYIPKDGALEKCPNKKIKLKPNANARQYFHWTDQVEDGLKLVNALYETAYKKTIWATNIEEIFQRNLAHVTRYNKSLLLITNSGKTRAFGYSHIIPINLKSWLNFRFGKMSTTEISEEYVVRGHKKSRDDMPFGILVLSLVMPAIDPHETLQEPYFKKVSDVVIDAMAYHISEICKEEFRRIETVPIIFETISPQILDYMKSHRTNGAEFTKDETQIVTFDLDNT